MSFRHERTLRVRYKGRVPDVGRKVGSKIPAPRIRGKETAVPTDSAKTQLDKILRDWSLLDGDERLAQARLEALDPIEKWLQSGAKSHEVVIRAVQTLLADPEVPGVDRLHAVEEVRKIAQSAWATAGAQEKGMLGLQALILAAWPQERSGWLTLAPLLDSAWSATRRSQRYTKWTNQWRKDIAQPPRKESVTSSPKALAAPKKAPFNPGTPTKSAETQQLKNIISGQWGTNHGNSFATIIETISSDLQTLATHISSINATIPEWQSIANSIEEIKQSLPQKTSNHEQALLWWGQARHSTTVGQPYRRITDSTERLWWIAVEASTLAEDVDVVSAASFLMETLLHIDGDIDTKRPLKNWLTDLFKTLRRIHNSKQYPDSNEMKFSTALQQLVEKDPLGLPVSWTRLQAIDSTLQESDFEVRAKECLGLDLDTLIDRGEFAAWIFRESLLDWRLVGVK